jgi:hypothetical protein
VTQLLSSAAPKRGLSLEKGPMEASKNLQEVLTEGEMPSLMNLALFSTTCLREHLLLRVLNLSFIGCTTNHAKLSTFLMNREVPEEADMDLAVARMFRDLTKTLIRNRSKAWFLLPPS